MLFFSIIERSVLMALVLLQRYIRKGNDVKNPAIFSFCLLPKEPTQRQNDCACSAILRVSSRAIACSVQMDARGSEASFSPNFKTSMDGNESYCL